MTPSLSSASTLTRVSRIGIVAKRGLSAAADHLDRLAEWLRARDVEPWMRRAVDVVASWPVVGTAGPLEPPALRRLHVSGHTAPWTAS